MTIPTSVVIVGASIAVSRTAEQLRHGGFDGRIAVVGAEAWRPYERPPLSKRLLAGAVEPTHKSLLTLV
jgi:3-phenylpropionate/trans-cinnamate dioxygenase ferredoxin reductase subunit